MKGYVYLDADENLAVKTFEYIQCENPNFFGENRHYVKLVLPFDSDNEMDFEEVLRSLARNRIPERKVREFCNGIGFDLDAFLVKKKAEKVQSLPK